MLILLAICASYLYVHHSSPSHGGGGGGGGGAQGLVVTFWYTLSAERGKLTVVAELHRTVRAPVRLLIIITITRADPEVGKFLQVGGCGRVVCTQR